MTVRLLNAGDVPAALELSAAAGWNQTAGDWARIIALEPRGCFGIDAEGMLAASTTLLTFGEDLAWVGMVLTRREYQRRGYARQLVCAALDEARARRVRCIKLDATDQGRPLYASLGFADEQPVERWRAEWRESGVAATSQSGGIPWELDTQAFGADRSRFVEGLGEPVAARADGYVMSRPGVKARYLGPCVAASAVTARELVGAALSTGAWFWDLLPRNTEAKALAQSLGFEPVRHLIRMRLGEPIRVRDDMVFAIAGFEAG
jgi:GNAT superfamily N-acetyltransferase